MDFKDLIKENAELFKELLGEGQKEKVKKAKMPRDVLKVANKELKRLQKIPSHSPEYTVSRTYLDWLIECYNQSNDKENFFTLNFDQLAGTNKLRLQIISGMSAKKISETWLEGLSKFQKTREKYLIY